MENIIIANPDLEDIKIKIAEDGANSLHLLTNFDNSLTKAFVNGEKIPSIISQIRNGKFLTKDYSKQAHDLYNKYHAIEIDNKLKREEKISYMQEWWRTHYNLLVELGLNKKDIQRVVKEGKVEFRKGFLDFLDLLKQNNIPMIVMSATGLGDAIELYFKKYNKFSENIHIISNFFMFDNNGRVKSIKEPIIHSMNKHEIILKQHNPEVFKKIEKRKNVILIGDRIEDIGMIQGFKYDNIIKIGFLNENNPFKKGLTQNQDINKKFEEQLEVYKKTFDIIITGDGDFSFINGLLREILK